VQQCSKMSTTSAVTTWKEGASAPVFVAIGGFFSCRGLCHYDMQVQGVGAKKCGC
jgi:hypothetical protein